MKRIVIGFVCCLSFALACSDSYTLEEKVVSEILESIGPASDRPEKYCVIIIPENACGTCVEGSFAYVLENLNKPSIYTIVTSYTNLKDVRLKYGVEVTSSQRILFDKEDVLSTAVFDLSNPSVLLMEMNDIKEIYTVKPASLEKVFNDVSDYLTNN